VLKSVIFDMDGVIVDSHDLHRKAWRQLLVSMGKHVTDADLDCVRDGETRKDMLRHFLGDLTEDEIQTHGLLKEQLFREIAQDINTIPGVRQLLNELSRAAVPMAVASSGSRVRVHYLLNLLQLRDYFATVVTGDQVPINKPNPAIFRKVAEYLQVRPTESLVFEDSVSGVRAATAAGMKCVGISSSDRANALLQAGADYVLPNLMDASLSQLQKLFA
jgi:beta-phosphoglucomutase